VRQRYHVAGAGPVCIVHSGGPGVAWEYLRMAAVEAELTTVYVEPVGTGESGRLPDHPRGYTVDRYSQFLHGIIEHLGLPKVHLLGHSHGGLVAQRYALERSDRLVGMILYDSAPAAGSELFAEATRNLGTFDRLSLHMRTLHPEFLGRTLAWAPNEPVEIHDREHGIEVSQAFMSNPVLQVLETGEPLVVRRAEDDDATWTKTDIYQGRHLAELVIVPLHNAEGPMSAATFGTVRSAGFSATNGKALERIVPALRNACELRTLRQGELTLLNTYVGATTGRRILAGRIRRGPDRIARCRLDAVRSARLHRLVEPAADRARP
jgi:pimeloyl-ACP methyl ester carboxylesterase